MKKLLLVFCIAVAANSLSAQHHFPKDSAEWKVYIERIDPPRITKDLYSYYYESDTILLGHTYHVINLAWPDTVYGTAFLREVDSTGKIYWLHNVTDTVRDRLLYDFSMGTGDSMEVIDPLMNDTIKWYVINEGTVTVNQQQRRFLDLEQDYSGSLHQDRWIEGIGSVSFLFRPIAEPPGWFETYYQMVCFTDKGTGFQYEPGIVTDTSYNCNSYVSNQEHAGPDAVTAQIYPNPFRDKLQIENGAGATMHFSLISPTGAEWASGRLGPYQNTVMETRHLPQGVYLIRYFVDGTSVSRKLIKTR